MLPQNSLRAPLDNMTVRCNSKSKICGLKTENALLLHAQLFMMLAVTDDYNWIFVDSICLTVAFDVEQQVLNYTKLPIICFGLRTNISTELKLKIKSAKAKYLIKNFRPLEVFSLRKCCVVDSSVTVCLDLLPSGKMRIFPRVNRFCWCRFSPAWINWI